MSDKYPNWKIDGELILNCNCTVFCPCVISLGVHYPTEGHCQAWLGVHIDSGHYDGHTLDGLNIGMVLDIPGRMSRGDWKVGTFIDKNASHASYHGLQKIFSGEARGTTRLFSLLVSEYLGVERANIEYQQDGKQRSFSVDKKIIGSVAPIEGPDTKKDVMVSNTGYWMGPDVTIAKASQGRVRAFGRVWDFEDRSAEICQINWSGPD